MASYLICPKRKNSRVALDICLGKCESRGECEEFKEMPRDELHAAMRKLEIPILEETLPTIEAEMIGERIETENPGKPQVEHVPAVSTPQKPLVNGEAARLYERVLSIRTEIEVRFFEMGEVLSQIFANRYYRDYGYQDWKSFCAGALDMSWRTATYLRDIYVKMTELDVPEQECAQVGWSKLKEVLPVIDKKNVHKWIDKAKKKGMTTEALNTEVRLARGKITKEEAQRLPTKMMFSLYEDQLENVERALEIAQRMTGSESRGYNLEMIAADFRGTYEAQDGEYTKARIICGLIGRIEAVMKIKIGEAVDAESGEILTWNPKLRQN